MCTPASCSVSSFLLECFPNAFRRNSALVSGFVGKYDKIAKAHPKQENDAVSSTLGLQGSNIWKSWKKTIGRHRGRELYSSLRVLKAIDLLHELPTCTTS